ncbi:LysR substrate-binding domain-containing protein [Deinococcus misasensis]|uniref:LysR substrate-binding domain-containing protein n=1 Tax=Deinococcus misasensis TaxID=392413 RepID=UPI00054EF74A|nr:LysR substrate-binding domain-containing protein [Deinococcus misasensis]
MNLNPEHLLTFLKVAELGSLSLAAEQLHLTQPAVSNQIKLLTGRVGEPLFARHRYGVRLTPAGEQLLPHARQVRRALEGTTRALQEWHGLQFGSLRLSASLTIAASILPRVLSVYHQQHPQVQLQVQQGNTREVLQLLLDARCEMALLEGHLPTLPADLEVETFRQDRLVLVIGQMHPLTNRSRLAVPELHHLPVIWRERGSGTREVAEGALQQARVTVQTVLELAGTEAVKEAVMQGLGAAFLSELTVQREVRSGELVQLEVDLPGLVRDLRVVRPPLEVLSRAGKAFLEHLKSNE